MELIIQHGGFTYPFQRSAVTVIAGDNTVEMLLQFGHGMMAHSTELIRNWGEGSVILSPRDLTPKQMEKVARDIRSLGGEIFLDPQCFAHNQDHQRLTTHGFWKTFQENSTAAFYGGPGTAEVLGELATFARSLGVSRHILPGLLANPVSEDWFVFQENIISEAPTHFQDDILLATIALSSDTMLSEEQIEAVIQRAASWGVHGFYIIAETPSGYLVDNPVWLANFLILAAGLKLLGRLVIAGYCSHQMLCLASANIDFIASGTWLNVRAFPPDKFFTPEEEDISRRATWYYCPQALSEYKLPFLDIAQRSGLLQSMEPAQEIDPIYAAPLFSGLTPSSVNWGEQMAFRHYLTSLHAQAALSHQSTFQQTVDYHLNLLDNAESLLRRFRAGGVMSQTRDFTDCLDANRSAITTLRAAQGPRLSRSWI